MFFVTFTAVPLRLLNHDPLKVVKNKLTHLCGVLKH